MPKPISALAPPTTGSAGSISAIAPMRPFSSSTAPSVQYYNNVGYSHMLRGDLKSALSSFRKAERLDPDNIVVANNLQLLADAAASAGA